MVPAEVLRFENAPKMEYFTVILPGDSVRIWVALRHGNIIVQTTESQYPFLGHFLISDLPIERLRTKK
jgi:hypothetical protein